MGPVSGKNYISPVFSFQKAPKQVMKPTVFSHNSSPTQHTAIEYGGSTKPCLRPSKNKSPASSSQTLQNAHFAPPMCAKDYVQRSAARLRTTFVVAISIGFSHGLCTYSKHVLFYNAEHKRLVL